MGSYCCSPAAVAREDVRANFPGAHHDYGSPIFDKNQHQQDGDSHWKRLTVLSSEAKSNGWIKDRYALDRELNRGEFDVTYLYMDHNTRELLACKSISKWKLGTPVDVEDVRREVAIMRHLPRSPSVMSLREACEGDRVVHLVMELCQGGELSNQIVARGHYMECTAAVIMRTIVEATAEAKEEAGNA